MSALNDRYRRHVGVCLEPQTRGQFALEAKYGAHSEPPVCGVDEVVMR